MKPQAVSGWWRTRNASARTSRLIVKTDQGERKMRSAFGAGLNQFMFQNVDLVLVNQMSQTLAQSIKRWEEHIKGINVGVMQSPETGRR